MTLPGDINGDGTVDLQDFGMVSKNWGLTLSPNPAPPVGMLWWDYRGDAFVPATTYADVCQGFAPSCYLMAPIAACLVAQPALIRSRISPVGIDMDGVRYWKVHLNKQAWRDVVVDSRFPSGVDLIGPWGARPGTHGETFAMLIEKAHLIVWGKDWSNYQMGDPNGAFTELLGGTSVCWFISNQTEQAVHDGLVARFSAGTPMTYGVRPGSPAPLVPDHAYAMVAVRDNAVDLWDTANAVLLTYSIQQFRDYSVSIIEGRVA